MRRLFRFPVSRAQGISARILLANHASGCNCSGEELRQMPMIRKRTSRACRTTHTNYKFMAFCPMGARSDRPNATRKGQVKYAVVAFDYFTKWVEAEALAIIMAARIEDFV